MIAVDCGGSMDSVSDMHPVMMLMSSAETDVQAEVLSGTDGSSFAPLPAFMDTILANYSGCPSQSSSQVGPNA